MNKDTFNVFECFAGIGAQHKALTRIKNNHELCKLLQIENVDMKVVGISEWYIKAIIAYDRIHNGKIEEFINKDLNDYKLNDKEEIRDYSVLKDETEDNIKFLSEYFKSQSTNGYALSLDSKDPANVNQLKKLKYPQLVNLYIAMKRNKNYGSISALESKHIKDKIDLLTYSFPCTDISNAGKGEGLLNSKRSGLLWEIKRVLEGLYNDKKLPKFLVMENVKTILSDKHIKGWNLFKEFLISIGYTNTMITINSLKVGIPQSRNRVFCISVFNGDKEIDKNGNAVKMLEKLTTALDLSKECNDDLITFLNIPQNQYLDECVKMIPNNTASRLEILEASKKLNHMDNCFTITTKADRKPNQGIFLCNPDGTLLNNKSNKIGKFLENNEVKDIGVRKRNVSLPIEFLKTKTEREKSFFRYMTARESIMLMGFDNSDYDKMEDTEYKLTPTDIQVFAGNSIVVNKLELIFKCILETYMELDINDDDNCYEEHKDSLVEYLDKFDNNKEVLENEQNKSKTIIDDIVEVPEEILIDEEIVMDNNIVNDSIEDFEKVDKEELLNIPFEEDIKNIEQLFNNDSSVLSQDETSGLLDIAENDEDDNLSIDINQKNNIGEVDNFESTFSHIGFIKESLLEISKDQNPINKIKIDNINNSLDFIENKIFFINSLIKEE